MSPEPGEILARTPRLVLRTLRAEDVADEYRWRRDPELAALNLWHTPPGTYSEFLDRFAAEFQGVTRERALLAIETANGVHAGHISFYNADRWQSAVEYGISINERRERGRGLGTEATVAFLAWAFASLPYQLVFLHTLRENEPALRCFARAGFVETGRVYREDRWMVRMEAFREAWLSRHGALAGAAPPTAPRPAPEIPRS